MFTDYKSFFFCWFHHQNRRLPSLKRSHWHMRAHTCRAAMLQCCRSERRAICICIHTHQTANRCRRLQLWHSRGDSHQTSSTLTRIHSPAGVPSVNPPGLSFSFHVLFHVAKLRSHPVTFLTSSDSRGAQVEPDGSTEESFIFVSYVVWIVPTVLFFSQLMSWACIFVGAGLFTLGIRGRCRMTDDIWIQIFTLLSGEFMQADVYSTAPKYHPRLEVHITWAIYDVSHADWPALLQIWCSG